MSTSPRVTAPAETGVIVVDHGSRRSESNEMFLEVLTAFRQTTDYPIVEPAHMELAEPSIETAFARCVQQGAKLVVIHPYFLLPGRHWDQDIPALAAQAAQNHPQVRYLVTAPLGVHPLMGQIMAERIEGCLRHTQQGTESCVLCRGTDPCEILPATS